MYVLRKSTELLFLMATPYKQHKYDGEKILPHTSSCVSYLGITNFIASNLSILTLVGPEPAAKLKQDRPGLEHEWKDV